MAPFQGKEAVRFSPLLSRILEEFTPGHPDPEFPRKTVAVAELSRLFTKRRDALGTDYLSDPTLAAAYLGYFFPVNLCKIQILLDELPYDWYDVPADSALRVLDLGAGPGTGGLAVLDWLNRHDPDSLKRLTVVAVDGSANALRQAQLLWTAYSRQVRKTNGNLILLEGDVAAAGNQGWRQDVVSRAPYDLILVSNCLNELFGGTSRAIKERIGLVADLLALLAPHGTLMLVEPALRETSRALHQVRDQLLQEQRCTIYSPCLHERNCPALIHEDDWCHEERAWAPPAFIQQIDEEVGFIKDALKFSYLLLRKDGKTIVERRSDVYRVVSELRELKGEKRAWLCNEQGRQEVGRQDRLTSPQNTALDRWHRGAIVQIERIVRKERGGKVSSLGRIEHDAGVQIIRPV